MTDDWYHSRGLSLVERSVGDTDYRCCNSFEARRTIITGPPNGPVSFCSLSSVVVCCDATGQAGRPCAWADGSRRARGRSGGRHCTAGQCVERFSKCIHHDTQQVINNRAVIVALRSCEICHLRHFCTTVFLYFIPTFLLRLFQLLNIRRLCTVCLLIYLLTYLSIFSSFSHVLSCRLIHPPLTRNIQIINLIILIKPLCRPTFNKLIVYI